MFERNTGNIPGYTGHQRGVEPVDTAPGKKVGIKHIPGKIRFLEDLFRAKVAVLRTFSSTCLQVTPDISLASVLRTSTRKHTRGQRSIPRAMPSLAALTSPPTLSSRPARAVSTSITTQTHMRVFLKSSACSAIKIPTIG